MKNFILSWALLLRVLFLRLKPPHFDESINGWFVMQIWQNGAFSYDPKNFHGPLYFYILQFSELILGRGIFAMRLVTALLAFACVALIAAHRRFFGRAALWAAAIVALSPAMVFYGRYAIHETLFILAQIIFSYGFWLYRERPSTRSLGIQLIGITAAVSTKETFFIFFGVWIIAHGCLKIYDIIETALLPERAVAPWRLPSQSLRSLSRPERWRALLYLTFAVFTLVCLFTGFLSDWSGVSKFFQAFAYWSKTGASHTGHEKPPTYWINLLALYEWPTLMALCSLPIVFIYRFSRDARFWSLVSFGTLLAYSLIPYKTPWCIIGIIWPLSLALGFVTTEFKEKVLALRDETRRKRLIPTYRIWRALLAVILLVGLYQTISLNFYHYADFKERYVYVQSTDDINTIMRLIGERIALAPQDKNMKIEILTEESWPFPWLLGDFPHVTFAHQKATDGDRLKDADIIFFDEKDLATVEAHLRHRYFIIPLNFRDAYQKGFAFLREDKFASLLPPGTTVRGVP